MQSSLNISISQIESSLWGYWWTVLSSLTPESRLRAYTLKYVPAGGKDNTVVPGLGIKGHGNWLLSFWPSDPKQACKHYLRLRENLFHHYDLGVSKVHGWRGFKETGIMNHIEKECWLTLVETPQLFFTDSDKATKQWFSEAKYR